MRNIQIYAVMRSFQPFFLYGPGDDVARGQILQRMVFGHERFAFAVAQHGPFPAQGFGNQKALPFGKYRRVELHKFHIHDTRAHAVSHGDAVPVRMRGIGGMAVHLPHAAVASTVFLALTAYTSPVLLSSTYAPKHVSGA